MANTHAVIEFAAPAALNTEVAGTQRGTTTSTFDLLGGPRILDATHETDPAAGDSYDFGIRRGTTTFTIAIRRYVECKQTYSGC